MLMLILLGWVTARVERKWNDMSRCPLVGVDLNLCPTVYIVLKLGDVK